MELLVLRLPVLARPLQLHLHLGDLGLQPLDGRGQVADRLPCRWTDAVALLVQTPVPSGGDRPRRSLSN